MTTLPLTAEHQALLEASAVRSDVAVAAGVRSVTRSTDLSFAGVPAASVDAWTPMLPGLLFAHERVDGSGRVFQLRPDHPVKPELKYMQEAGTGTVTSLTPQMRERAAGEFSELWLVEGTKQSLAAASWAPDDVVVVGILGCWGWSVGEGSQMVRPEIATVAHGRRVVVWLDADRRTNPAVYDAGKALAKGLEAVGATVAFADIPAGAKSGLDDYLAAAVPDEALRTEALVNLAVSASTKLGRRPSVKRTGPSAYEVDWDGGVVVSTNPDNPAVKNVEFDMAVRVVTARTSVDAHGQTKSVVLTLQAATGRAGEPGRREWDEFDVSAADFDVIARWKALATPGSSAGALTQTPSPAQERLILNAIRDTGAGLVESTRFDLPGLRQHPGLGWVWVASNGALSAHGWHPELSGGPAGEVVELVNPFEFTTAEQVEAIRRYEAATCADAMPNRAWDFITGMAFANALTNSAVGLTYVHGEPGSGKTTIVENALMMARGMSTLSTVEDTQGAMAETGRGLAFSVAALDDVRDHRDDRRNSAQENAVEALARVAYEGDRARRTRLTRDALTGEYSRKAADGRARPMLIISGENIPSLGMSTAQRIVPMFFRRNQTWSSELDLDEFKRAVVTDARLAWAVALRQALTMMNAGWSVSEALADSVETAPKVFAMLGFTPGMHRASEIAGSLMTGRLLTAMMLEFVLEVAPTEAALIAALDERSTDVFEEAPGIVAAHWQTIGTRNATGVDVLDRLRGSVESGRYIVDVARSDDDERRTRLGDRIAWKGVECVALIPSVVADIFGEKQSVRLVRALMATGAVVANSSDQPVTPVKVGGSFARRVLVRADVWDLADADDGATENPA